jgi:hypothetical protein
MSLVFHVFIRLVLFLASIAMFVPCVAANVPVLESCPQYQHPANPADIIGMVRDLDSGELLYCEYHVFDKSDDSEQANKKTHVEYRAFDQTLIATKLVDYSPGLLRPNVVQNDLRNNELRSSFVSSLNSEMITTAYEKESAVNVSYRRPNSEAIESTSIELEEMLVIDVGFDEAVKKYWYTLTRGEKLIINFLSPMHLRTIKLIVKRSNTDNCYKEVYDRKTQACFLIRPANMVLNLFVQPLSLTYDLISRRLLRFKGDVNITDAQGDTQNAIIEYYYTSKF